MAIAIADRAIQNGATALFTTAAELIDDLSAASREGRLRQTLAKYIHPHVLVVDEVGYLAYGDDAANVLFHVVNDRHRRKRAMIFTTNKPLSAWGRVLHDDDLAETIVDRTLERGRLLVLDGPSVRTPHLTLPLIRLTHHRTEFPEPAQLTMECVKRQWHRPVYTETAHGAHSTIRYAFECTGEDLHQRAFASRPIATRVPLRRQGSGDSQGRRGGDLRAGWEGQMAIRLLAAH